MKLLTLALTALAALTPVVALAGAFEDLPPAAIPEPATLGLMAVGVAGALIASRFRKKK